jgi:hypothetical protein
MIASGWQTAPPLDFEVVLATNSACPLSLEAPSRVTDLHRAAPPTPSLSVAAAKELSLLLAQTSGLRSRASASRTLSVPTVSRP